MGTNRQMYEEAKDLFYRKNWFHVVEPSEEGRIATANFWPVKYLKQAKRLECNLTFDVNDPRRGSWQTRMRNAFRFLAGHPGILSLLVTIDFDIYGVHAGSWPGAYKFVLEDIESALLLLEDVRVKDDAAITFENYGESVRYSWDSGLDYEPDLHNKLQGIRLRLESTMRGENGPVVGTRKRKKR